MAFGLVAWLILFLIYQLFRLKSIMALMARTTESVVMVDLQIHCHTQKSSHGNQVEIYFVRKSLLAIVAAFATAFFTYLRANLHAEHFLGG